MNLIQYIEKNPFFLAPMAGITTSSVRRLMRELGCGVLTTELVSVTGLSYESLKTMELLNFHKSEHPIGVQFFGSDPIEFAKAAEYAQKVGYDFLDLNLGCPVGKVVKKGAGAALMQDLSRVCDIIRSIKAHSDLPVTMKIRLGWNDQEHNAEQICCLAQEEGVSWVTIHGRTRSQGYSGRVDWDAIGCIAENVEIPIIGNGDVLSAEQAVDYLNRYCVKGIMIGRGILKNPFLFHQCLMNYQAQMSLCDQNALSLCFTDHLSVLKRLLFYLEEEALNKDPLLLQLKKFSSWFSFGFPDSAQFRQKLFGCSDKKELWLLIQDYFEEKMNLTDH